MQQTHVLPLVNISQLNSTDAQQRLAVAQALDRACREVGFLYIQGDQLQPELFDALVRTAQHYFAQPLDLKMQHYIGHSENHSGYVPIGEEQFNTSQIDLKEAYDINYDYLELTGRRPLLGPTLWPEDVHFKQHVNAYYQHLQAIGRQLFAAFAQALGHAEDFFIAHLQHPPSQLRLIHYPYHAHAHDQEGIGAHTDYECFTLLFATTDGLQVLNKQGQWIDIPVVANSLIMNIGDMMEILSNGRYMATKHRVKKVSAERYSFPLFFSCDYDYEIAPIVHNESAKYAALKGGEHLFNQTAQTFQYLKQRIARGELQLHSPKALNSFGLAESHVQSAQTGDGQS